MYCSPPIALNLEESSKSVVGNGPILNVVKVSGRKAVFGAKSVHFFHRGTTTYAHSPPTPNTTQNTPAPMTRNENKTTLRTSSATTTYPNSFSGVMAVISEECFSPLIIVQSRNACPAATLSFSSVHPHRE